MTSTATFQETSHGYLKISTYEQKINFDVVLLFNICKSFVDLVEFAVTTAFHCYLHRLATTVWIFYKQEQKENFGSL